MTTLTVVFNPTISEMNNEIKLVSKRNIKMIPNKNSKKNKNRFFYSWTLERVKTVCKVDFEIHTFPSSPEMRKIQKLKETIITELNRRNIFDFDFSPMEKDYLSIKNKKDSDDYLNLIFIDGKWIEEFYINSKRLFSDIYLKLDHGELELI